MRINKNLAYIFIILAVLLAIISLYFNYFKGQAYKGIEIDIDLNVGNYTGINIDTDKIYFGTILPGGSGNRVITIHNPDIASMIVINKKGELSDWVYPEENKFYMEPNEIKNITISAEVPSNAEYGNYKGELQILFTNI